MVRRRISSRLAPDQRSRSSAPVAAVGEILDGAHQGADFLCGEVPGERLGPAGSVAAGDQRASRYVGPPPDRGVAAERPDRVDLMLQRGDRERLPGELAEAARQPPQVLLHQRPVDLSQGGDLGMLPSQPAHEPAQPFTGEPNGLRSVEPRYQPDPQIPLDGFADRGHAGFGQQPVGPGRATQCPDRGRLRDLADVEQQHVHLVQLGQVRAHETTAW